MHRDDAVRGRDGDAAGVDAVPTAVPWSLDDAEHHGHAMARRRVHDGVEMPGLDLHRLIEIVGVQHLLHVTVEPCAVGLLDPERVSGHERFGERQQCDAVRRRFGDGLHDPGDGAVTMQPHGSKLRPGDAEGVGHANEMGAGEC